MQIKPHSLILFQGDSVTDCDRKFESMIDLGKGYPNMIAGALWAKQPDDGLKFINRGISGNRTKDLYMRWVGDCINLQPDYVSILIGINDVWREFDSNDATPIEDFETNLRNVLDLTKRETDAKIIMMEPFVLPYPLDRIKWLDTLAKRRELIKNLSKEYGATFVPLYDKLHEIGKKIGYTYLAQDGVHPTPFGHAVIAKQWMDIVLND